MKIEQRNHAIEAHVCCLENCKNEQLHELVANDGRIIIKNMYEGTIWLDLFNHF